MTFVRRYAGLLRYWVYEIRVLLVFFAIAAVVGAVTASFTAHPHSTLNHTFAVQGRGAPSWELVPGNNCWNDKANVLGQLKSAKYDMDQCAHNDGGLITEWWTKAHWPTVVVRQHYAGAPITVDSVYYPSRDESVDAQLDLVQQAKPQPVAVIIDAAKALLAQTPRLLRLPSQVDCVSFSHLAPLTGQADGRAVRFVFRYFTISGSHVVRPKSCPLA